MLHKTTFEMFGNIHILPSSCWRHSSHRSSNEKLTDNHDIACNDDFHCVCRPFDLFASLTQMPGWAQVGGHPSQYKHHAAARIIQSLWWTGPGGQAAYLAVEQLKVALREILTRLLNKPTIKCWLRMKNSNYLVANCILPYYACMCMQ